MQSQYNIFQNVPYAIMAILWIFGNVQYAILSQALRFRQDFREHPIRNPRNPQGFPATTMVPRS